MRKAVSPLMLKVAILCVAIQDIGAGAAAPALARIINAFPTINPSTVMMITTIPCLVTIFVSPLYGKLSEYFRKRTLITFAMICFLIGGITPAFLNNMTLILLMRAVLGIGVGIFIPVGVNLITDFFEDQHERDTMIGLNMTFANIGGMFFQLAGGYLASIDWHYCFYAYIFSILMFAVIFFFLPEPEKKHKAEIKDKNQAKLPGRIIPIILVYFIFNILWFAMITNTSIMIENSHYGDPSKTGIALTLYTFGSLVIGMLFGSIIKALKAYTLPFGYFVSAVGYFICFFSMNLAMVYAGTFIAGLGIGITISATYSKVSIAVPQAAVAMCLSLTVSAMALGQFVQPFVYDIVFKLLGMTHGRAAFVISASCMLCMCFIMLIYNVVSLGQIKKRITL